MSPNLARPNYQNTVVTRNGYNNDIVKTLNSSFNAAVRQSENVRFSGNNKKEIARAIFNYLKNNVTYKRDSVARQVIQLPSRLLLDTQAGDCKSLALAAAAFLAVNGFNNVRLRYASYKAGDATPSHVYTVASDEMGRDIILDVVYKKFNQEAPYISKQDYPMNIEVLSGMPFQGRTAVTKIMRDTRPLDKLGRLNKLLAQTRPGGLLFTVVTNEINRQRGRNSNIQYNNSQLQAYGKLIADRIRKAPNTFLRDVLTSEFNTVMNGQFSGVLYTPRVGMEISGLEQEIGRLRLRKLLKKVTKRAGSILKKGAAVVKKINPATLLKGIKMVGFVAPRKAFLALVSLNVRGLATRMNKLSQSDLNSLWVKKFGGKLSVLNKAIRVGAGKRPLFGASKRTRAIKGIGYVIDDMPVGNASIIGAEPATSSATVATIIAASAPILITVVALLAKRKVKPEQYIQAAAASAGALAESTDFTEAGSTAADGKPAWQQYLTQAQDAAEKLGIIPDKPMTPAEQAASAALPGDEDNPGGSPGSSFNLSPGMIAGGLGLLGLAYYATSNKSK